MTLNIVAKKRNPLLPACPFLEATGATKVLDERMPEEMFLLKACMDQTQPGMTNAVSGSEDKIETTTMDMDAFIG